MTNNSAIIFDKINGSWTQSQEFKPDAVLSLPEIGYGQSVAVYGGQMMIATKTESIIYYFEFDGSQWVQNPDIPPIRQFANQVIITDEFVLIGNT